MKGAVASGESFEQAPCLPSRTVWLHIPEIEDTVRSRGCWGAYCGLFAINGVVAVAETRASLENGPCRVGDHRGGRAARQMGGIGARQRALTRSGRGGHQAICIRRPEC